MYAVDRWFEKQARSQKRAVLLEDAFLSGRFAPYAWYRLRYFTGRAAIATLLHAIEFLFLLRVFHDGLFLEALLVRAATTFAASWWWGSLETLREEVRRLHREKRLHLAPRVISGWLALAGLLALCVLLLAGGWAALDALRRPETSGVFRLYVGACGLRLALSLVARTYHSGVYAIRRIYRPFLALVGVDLCGFCGVLLLWPFLDRWSFPLMAVVTSLAAALITFWTTSRVYRFLGLAPFRAKPSAGFRLLKVLVSKHFVFGGASYALMKLDAVLIFALFHSAGTNGERYQEFIVFYLLSPLVRASHDWAQLFYFDLKRLEVGVFANFRHAFETLVDRLAWVLGIVFWLAASLYVTIILAAPLGLLYLALGLFFLVRSRLAFFQIRAFALRRYGDLLLSGLVLVGGVLAVEFVTAGGAGERLVFLTLALAAPLLYLGRTRLGAGRRLEEAEILPAQEWLQRTASLGEPLRIRTVRVCNESKERTVEALARQISRKIRRVGRVTLMEKGRIVWYELGHEGSGPPDAWLLRSGAGLVESLQATPTSASGWEALRAAEADGILGRAFRRSWFDGDTPQVENVRTRFLEHFSGGMVYEPLASRRQELEALSGRHRHEIMHAAIRYARNIFETRAEDAFDVTALCERGAIRFVFVIDKAECSKKRQSWRTFVTAANLRIGLRDGTDARHLAGAPLIATVGTSGTGSSPGRTPGG